MKKRIYIALSTFAEVNQTPLKLLEESGYDFDINKTGKRLIQEQMVEVLTGYHGVVAGLEPYNAKVLAQLPVLECISRCGVGIDNIDLEVASKQHIKVLNTPQAVIVPVAELTIAFIFDLLRNVTVHHNLMRAHQWQRIVGKQLAGKTVGIIGLGRIGRHVAVLLTGLGAKVIGVDVKPDYEWAASVGVQLVTLEQLLTQSDIVSLHVAQLLDGSFCLDQKHFSKLRKGALLINTARGSLVNEEDLIVALRNGQLAGAALDVFEKEPYSGPLCELDNVILSAHCATLTQESRLEMEVQAVENIINYFKGQ